MHNFSRALKIAFAHRVNLVGCVLTSLLIAVLWGGNLTAVFPVVDVIMNDQSLPQWIDHKIAESDREVAESSRWLAQLESLINSTPEQIQEQIRAEIAHRREELETHQEALREHLERRADCRKDPARKSHQATGNTANDAARRCGSVHRTGNPRDGASHRRVQPARRPISLDRPGGPSLDARHAIPHAPGRVPVRARVHASQGRGARLEQHRRRAIGARRGLRLARGVLPPGAAARHGQFHRSWPRRSHEPLLVGPQLHQPGCAPAVRPGPARAAQDAGLLRHRGLGQLAAFAADDHHRSAGVLFDSLLGPARSSARTAAQCKSFHRSTKRSPKRWAASS